MIYYFRKGLIIFITLKTNTLLLKQFKEKMRSIFVSYQQTIRY
jgi:hypothetical protein